MSKFAQDNYRQRPNAPWISRPYGILLVIFSLLAVSLFYLEVSRHGRANINPDLDRTPLGTSSDSASPPPNTDTELLDAIASPHCKIGDLYGSCLNEIRYFQCTPDGPLAHPCPAGQKFFCTGEGEGACDERHSTKWSGKGFEMICEGEEELGACKKV